MHEDKTKYGEQIPSLFSWITLEEQKKRAEELNSITEKKSERIKKNNRPS